MVYVADDGSVEVFETIINGNYLEFTTSHLSEFYILGDTSLDLWWLIITLAVILLIEIIVIVVLALRRREDGKGGKESKVSAFVPPVLAVNLIPAGAIPAIVVLGVLVLIAAAVIVALLIRGRRKAAGEPAEEDMAAGEPEEVEEASAETSEETVEETTAETAGESVEQTEAQADEQPENTPTGEVREETVEVEKTAETVRREETAVTAAAAAAVAGGAGLVIGQTFIRYRYNRSFEARLIQSEDRVKKYYSELKNELLSYSRVSSRMSWQHDGYRRSRPIEAKFVFRGKTLCRASRSTPPTTPTASISSTTCRAMQNLPPRP